MQKTLIKKKAALKTTLPANQLNELIAKIPKEVKIISFDCFDTLIWRNTIEPKDVFYDLCQHPVMQELGFTVALRTMSENVAYQLKKIKTNTTQVSLNEIYTQAFPDANDALIQQLVDIEIEAEMKTCFAYQPMAQLIEKLHQLGYKIIIISDIYFTKPMLLKLLSHCLPASTLPCIQEIFTSCDHNTAKYEKLFQKVLDKNVINASQLLHIGDHPISDVDRPTQFGINTAHLVQYNASISEMIRMSPVVAPYLDDSIRKSRALTLPFKGLFAEQLENDSSPATLIGYSVIGPILLAFAEYCHQTIEQLTVPRERVKVGFLLRDAYLPARVYQERYQTNIGKDIRVSRFSAFAASFRTEEDIDTYLAGNLASLRFKEIGKQLGLSKELTDRCIAKASKSKDPSFAFNQAIHQPAILKQIFEFSKAYRERLFHYLQKEMNLQQGDTLVFVDLGYTGTAQLRLAPVFKEEYNIDIIGCYLISLKTRITAIKKSGLLDARHYDDKTLVMLVTYIALLEQICTSTEQSVVDFDAKGNPIYSETKLDEQQVQRIKHIHEACLAFIRDVRLHPTILNDQQRRDLAAINLVRLLYMPTKLENDYFGEFNHDVNMGADDVIPLIDIKKSLHDLKKRGWLHSLKMQSSEARMNYPSEWRSISLELSLLLMAQHRYDFKVTPADLTHRELKIPVIYRINNENHTLELSASATFDGYYALIIPITVPSDIGIPFGQLHPNIHLYAVDKIDLQYFATKHESKQSQSILDKCSLHEMLFSEDGLLISNNDEGLFCYSETERIIKPYVLRLIFKPFIE